MGHLTPTSKIVCGIVCRMASEVRQLGPRAHDPRIRLGICGARPGPAEPEPRAPRARGRASVGPAAIAFAPVVAAPCSAATPAAMPNAESGCGSEWASSLGWGCLSRSVRTSVTSAGTFHPKRPTRPTCFADGVSAVRWQRNSPALASTLALFLRQPLLVAYIFIGGLLGPFGFGYISDLSLLTDIAEFGIIFLLFLLGLDMQPSKLLHTPKKTFLVTLASSIVFILRSFSTGLLFNFSNV